MTARTPASARMSRPSRNGKKASDAAYEPAAGRIDFMIATLAASTRLICPAPIPTDCDSLVRTIAFDFTCAQTIQANSRPFISSVDG
jgi:hypothetical protein